MSKLRYLCVTPFVLALLLFQGCAQVPAQFRYHPEESAVPELVWPSPPEQPRYRYVGELTGEENFYRPGEESANVVEGFLRWVVGLAGHSPNPVVLQRPQAVIGSESGRIYVTDVSRQAVFMFDTAQPRLEVWEYAGKELVITPIQIGCDWDLTVIHLVTLVKASLNTPPG